MMCIIMRSLLFSPTFSSIYYIRGMITGVRSATTTRLRGAHGVDGRGPSAVDNAVLSRPSFPPNPRVSTSRRTSSSSGTDSCSANPGTYSPPPPPVMLSNLIYNLIYRGGKSFPGGWEWTKKKRKTQRKRVGATKRAGEARTSTPNNKRRIARAYIIIMGTF